MYDLYQLTSWLRLTSEQCLAVDCCVNESLRGVIVCLLTTDHHLLLCFLANRDDESDSNDPGNASTGRYRNPQVRQVPLDPEQPIRAMCFDETGSWLLLAAENSRIFLVPVSRVMAYDLNEPLDFDATAIDCCSLQSPTDLVWWKSMDGHREIAIVGNEFGEISFVDIKQRAEIGGTYVQHGISSLEIIRDKDAVSLLIGCKNDTRWRLTLEETRPVGGVRNSRRRSSASSEDWSSEHQPPISYMACLMSLPAEESPGPVDCWENRPKLIDWSWPGDERTEDQDPAATRLLYQWPFILAMAPSSDGGELGQVVVRLIPCNEFDYNLSGSVAKYLIPKTSPDPVEDVVLNDRFFLVCTEKRVSIISREFADSRKLAKLNCVVQEIALTDEDENECFLDVLRLNETDGLLNWFVIVTNKRIIKCHPRTTCQQMFIDMVLAPIREPSTSPSTCEAAASIRAQRLAAMLRLNSMALYEQVADQLLKDGDLVNSHRFYQQAKTPPLKRITNLLAYGLFDETIEFIKKVFSTRTGELEDEDDYQHFANICVSCMIHRVLEKRVSNEEADALKKLKEFLRFNSFYDENVAIRSLVENGLFDLASFAADLRAEHGQLLANILKADQLIAKTIGQELLDKLGQDLMLAEPTNNKMLLDAATSPKLTQALVLRQQLIDGYLRYLIRLLPKLDFEYLTRVAIVFDPRRAISQLLLNRVLTQFRLSYLNNDDDDEESMIQKKKDILNLFTFVHLMVIRQQNPVVEFDSDMISIDKFIEERKKRQEEQQDWKMSIDGCCLSAGQMHAGYVRFGSLYLWGLSAFGCAGTAEFGPESRARVQERIAAPTCHRVLAKTMALSVKAVACGAQHTIALTDFGVYSFGSSKFGQLGLGSEVAFAREPHLISDLTHEKVIAVECGQYHSMAITSEGRLLTWGWGVHGQLGHSDVEDVYKPKTVNFFVTNNHKVLSASGGYGHSIVLTADGSVWSFGNGMFGQLGLGTNVKHSTPQLVQLPSRVRLISTNYFHCLALSDDRQLFFWGLNPQVIRLQAQCLRKTRANNGNNNGQEKMPEPSQEHLSPSIVDTSAINGRIIKIRAGNHHSVILNSFGEVFTFGRGSDGQLGHGRSREVKMPTMVVTLNDRSMVDIAAGADYSLAVDVDGQLFGWGQNNDCQLGTGVVQRREDRHKKLTIKTNKRLVTLMSGEKNVHTTPVRIFVDDGQDSYVDSLNYSIDISQMKTSASVGLQVAEHQSMASLTSQNDYQFDIKNLVTFLIDYHQQLDLNSVLNRCLQFKCFQLAAFVSQLQKNLGLAVEYQMKALFLTSPEQSTVLLTGSQILSALSSWADSSIEDQVAVIDGFVRACLDHHVELSAVEKMITDCYTNHISDCLFGISFFTYLTRNPEAKDQLSSTFLLELIELTAKLMEQKPDKLFVYQSAIEKMTEDIGASIRYPTEELWQSILRSIESKNGQSRIELVPTEDKLIVFTCQHHFGEDEFRSEVVPEFLAQVSSFPESVEVGELLQLAGELEDERRESWSSACPRCVLDEFKKKIADDDDDQ